MAAYVTPRDVLRGSHGHPCTQPPGTEGEAGSAGHCRRYRLRSAVNVNRDLGECLRYSGMLTSSSSGISGRDHHTGPCTPMGLGACGRLNVGRARIRSPEPCQRWLRSVARAW